MFGSLGGPELLLIFVLALLLFGPRKLPEIGRTIGRTLGELRKATGEFRTSLEREVELETLKDARNQIRAVGQETAGAVRDASSEARSGAPAAEGPKPEPDGGSSQDS